MTRDSFLKALEEHFVSLNHLVHKSLLDLDSIHREVLEKYTAGAKDLQSKKGQAQESEDKIRRTLAFHQANQEICNSLYTGISENCHLTGLLSDIKQEDAKILERIPFKMPLEYPLGYFHWNRDKPFRSNVKRRTEWILLAPKQSLGSLLNPLRRLAGKQGPEAIIPAHQVRARQLYRRFLLPLYLKRVSELILEVRKEISRSMTLLWEDDLKPVPEIRWEERYNALLGHFYPENQEAFGQLLNQSGTPLTFTRSKIRSKRGSSKSAFSQIEYMERSWRITFYALFEDWRFREKLFAFIQEVKLLSLEVSSIFSGRIRTKLYPELEKQNDFTSRLLLELPDPDKASMEELKSFLVKELYSMNKEKQQNLQDSPGLEEAEGIPGILQKLESSIQEKLQVFPPKVGVVNDPDYEKGIKQTEIRYFSPREFLEFSSLAEFIQVNQKLKADLSKVLEKTIREFREFDQIIDFYLDSAVALTQKPGIKEKEVVGVFREGITRLEGICQRNQQMLGVLEREKWSEISANTETFIDSVRKLEDNDNIINIYTRLLKSKALASSVQNKSRLISGVKSLSVRISQYSSEHFKWLRASYEDIRKRLKLDSGSATITSEISNYLAGIRTRITELPVIYQYLFESAPVKELNLFLKRDADTGKLDQALAAWEKGNFAATLVSGETGSGCSSLLQYYAKSLKSQYPIVNFQVENFYYRAEDYYSLINEIFNQEDIRDKETLAQFLSTLSDKIVIVDGLERLFVRKVNGFECLHRFLSLVVNTDESIFWICSVSKNAFNYLNRTVSLSEHFDYILDIDNMKGSDIREIIMKRNRLSGYSIQFLKSTGESEDDSPAIQEELEEAYFMDLEKSSGGNIGLSLTYWLQSVQSIGDEGIKVEKFFVPDLEFLNNLPARKTYALLLVIMHEKISVEYHSLVCNCSSKESSALLSILKEDSILVRQGEYFYLNGVLYKHVVKLLRDRNLIH